MGDRIAQLILEKIDTPPVKEVQGLEDTVHGSGGFGSIGVNRQNDIGEKKEMNGENERTGEKDEVVKNKTLKGSDSGRKRTDKNKKKNERISRLSCE